MALTAIAGLSYGAATAAATPQVPPPPKLLYTGPFERGLGTAPVLLTNYLGVGDVTYRADTAWTTFCNGWILEFNTPQSALNLNTCQPRMGMTPDSTGWGRLRQMAYVLGLVEGETPAQAMMNHAVTAYTNNDPSATAVQLQTNTATPIPVGNLVNRYITFGVDAAEVNCNSSVSTSPDYVMGHAPAMGEFSLTEPDGTNPQASFIHPITPCTSPLSTDYPPGSVPNPPGVPGTFTSTLIRAGQFTSDASVLFTGNNIGLKLQNSAGTGLGNDAAFDNIRVYDSTPVLDKSFDPARLPVGDVSQLTYTITNPSDLVQSDGWSFTDKLPAGLVVAGTANGNGSSTCSNSTVSSPGGGDTIHVTADILSGQAYCTVTVDVTSAAAGIYTNGAANVTTIGLDEPGDATVQFGDVADMAISKTGTPNPVVPGHNVSFTLHVSNLGPDRADDVVVSDPVPAPFTFVSASSPCQLAQGTVTCNLGSVAGGDSRNLTIVMHLPSSATNGVTNTATVSSSTADQNHNNNSATVSLPAGPQADLQIQKRASVSRVAADGQVVYTLAVTNLGPSDATGVTVADPLPSDLTAVSVQPSQGSCQTTAGVVCTLGSIGAGGQAQILVAAHVAHSAQGMIRNAATVDGGQPDPNRSNNLSAESIHVDPIPTHAIPRPPEHLETEDVHQRVLDVGITKHVDHPTAHPGQRLTYTLHVTNHSILAASSVNVTDTADHFLHVISARSSRGSCTVGRPLRCELGGLPVHGRATITVVARATRAGTLRNTATVTSAAHDGDPSTDIARATVRVAPVLRLTKRAVQSTVIHGQNATFQLTVTNPTSVAIHHVSVCDRLPSGLSFHSSSPSTQARGGQRCWAIGTLAAGRSEHLTLVATVTGVGRLRNTATASGSGVSTVSAHASVVETGAPNPTG